MSLFKRTLANRVRASRAFDPLSMRTDLDRLREGGVNVLLSTVYAPERGIIRECRYLQLMRYLLPRTWKMVFDRPHFDVTIEMLDAMEEQVKVSGTTQSGKPVAKMACSVQELNDILDERESVAVIHNVEGAHSLDGRLDNVQRLFDRGVAYLTLAHFYANEAVNPCFPYPESVQHMGCFTRGRNLALGLEPFGDEVVEKMVELGMICLLYTSDAADESSRV